MDREYACSPEAGKMPTLRFPSSRSWTQNEARVIEVFFVVKVGVNITYYRHGQERNIIDVVERADYVEIYDLNSALVKFGGLSNRLLNRHLVDVQNRRFVFNDFDLNRVDILHFFNAISFGKTPWITTFETILPRLESTLAWHHGRERNNLSYAQDKGVRRALEALSGEACRQLIALSECSLNMQMQFLNSSPGFRSRIEHKLTCLHPPQRLLIDSYESKKVGLEGPIRFMFVGRSFFRKGGREILEAFTDLKRNHGYDLQLTIVSSLNIDDYATKEKEEDVEKAKAVMQTNCDWIHHYETLSNRKVLELMKASHVGLLPTYADTYGYSVLEFQASGCPVISTNVRALPEINNDEVGWRIEVPKNELGEALHTTEEDRSVIQCAIKEGIKAAVSEIFENRQIILRKANAGLQRLIDQHSPENHARRLREIYHRALGRDF